MGMGQEFMDDLVLQAARREEHMSQLASNLCWETADKRVLKIADMEEGHLRSTIKWLTRNTNYYFANTFISLMEKELETRI